MGRGVGTQQAQQRIKSFPARGMGNQRQSYRRTRESAATWGFLPWSLACFCLHPGPSVFPSPDDLVLCCSHLRVPLSCSNTTMAPEDLTPYKDPGAPLPRSKHLKEHRIQEKRLPGRCPALPQVSASLAVRSPLSSPLPYIVTIMDSLHQVGFEKVRFFTERWWQRSLMPAFGRQSSKPVWSTE